MEVSEGARRRISVRHEHGAHYHVRIRNHGLVVDQPVAAGGADLGPTPTELFVAGLASCVAYYAGRYLIRHGISTVGFRVDCDFEMSTDAPSRVSSIRIDVVLPPGFPSERREAIRRVAEHCSVHNSIRNALDVSITTTAAERAA